MKPASAGIILSTVSEAERLMAASSITLECDTPIPLSTSPFRQINITWAFELIIGGVAAFDVTFFSYLDKWFASCYRDPSGTSLLHSTRLVEENFYCIIMLNWKVTVKVLQDNETFASHFGPNLTPLVSYTKSTATLASTNAPRQPLQFDLPALMWQRTWKLCIRRSTRCRGI